MNLPETFFNPKQARVKANPSSKKKTKGKRKGKKKIQKSKSLKLFLLMPGPKCLECDSGGKNG